MNFIILKEKCAFKERGLAINLMVDEYEQKSLEAKRKPEYIEKAKRLELH